MYEWVGFWVWGIHTHPTVIEMDVCPPKKHDSIRSNSKTIITRENHVKITCTLGQKKKNHHSFTGTTSRVFLLVNETSDLGMHVLVPVQSIITNQNSLAITTA